MRGTAGLDRLALDGLVADTYLIPLAPTSARCRERCLEIVAEVGVEPAGFGCALECPRCTGHLGACDLTLRRRAQQLLSGGAAATLEEEAGLRGVLEDA